jgi:hypothetical protein
MWQNCVWTDVCLPAKWFGDGRFLSDRNDVYVSVWPGVLLFVPVPDHVCAAAFDYHLPYFFSFICKDTFIIGRIGSNVKNEYRTLQKKEFLL